jgi:hypothetical protein
MHFRRRRGAAAGPEAQNKSWHEKRAARCWGRRRRAVKTGSEVCLIVSVQRRPVRDLTTSSEFGLFVKFRRRLKRRYEMVASSQIQAGNEWKGRLSVAIRNVDWRRPWKGHKAVSIFDYGNGLSVSTPRYAAVVRSRSADLRSIAASAPLSDFCNPPCWTIW